MQNLAEPPSTRCEVTGSRYRSPTDQLSALGNRAPLETVVIDSSTSNRTEGGPGRGSGETPRRIATGQHR